MERTFAWLGRSRRLSKDYEELGDNSEAMLQIAMIRLMLHRLCRPPQPQGEELWGRRIEYQRILNSQPESKRGSRDQIVIDAAGYLSMDPNLPYRNTKVKFGQSESWVKLESVQRSLPARSVLISILRFSPLDLSRAKGVPLKWLPPRYIAWVIPADARSSPKIVDLGPASEIGRG